VRHETIRLQNARIAASARVHHFGDLSPVPFLCECDDDACREFVTLTLGVYEHLQRKRLHVVARGHLVDGGEPTGERGGYDTFRARPARRDVG
jgi:hypothetical protein